jgi:DMSO/TMAO reductase YedYZ heme-binding membrane subunit
VTLAAASAGPSALWYLTRSSGAVALILLTVAVALGVLDQLRWRIPGAPRFVVDALHRNVSLLALAFLGVHIVTSLLDSYAPIRIVDAVVPFISSYRPIWLGLGALASDLLIAVAITSVVRRRFGYRAWRLVHWLAYAAWPIALVHTLGTGSDVKPGWMLVLSLVCAAVVALAVAARIAAADRSHGGRRLAATAGLVASAGALAVWLPLGPLGSGWARRAGTPASLLAASSTSPASVTTAGASAGQALPLPFTATLGGNVTDSQNADGLETVDLAMSYSGARQGTLDVVLVGNPLTGGGVAVSRTHVSLRDVATSGTYTGRVHNLDGSQLTATVRDSAGRAVMLDISVAVDEGTQTVSGTFDAQQAGGGDA